MRWFRVLFLFVTLIAAAAAGRAGGHRFSVSAFGSVTTSSKLFPWPNARDDIARGTFSPIDAVLGAGVDIRGPLPGAGLALGLAAEYLAGSIASSIPNTTGTIPVEDGYVAIPVEATGYFSIPVGGPTLDFYMGGGAGLYFGGRVYRYAGVEASTLDRSIATGIHVLTGLGYSVTGRLLVRTELKFRNVQLETVQRFDSPATVYDGVTVPLPQGRFTSRIQVDGMHFILGLALLFP